MLMGLADPALAVLATTRAELAEEVGFPPELVAIGGVALLVCGVMMWAGRWRRWFTFNLPSSGDLPVTAYFLMSAPYVCTGIGLLLLAFGLFPYLPGVAVGALLLASVCCILFSILEWLFVTQRNLEKLFGRHPWRHAAHPVLPRALDPPLLRGALQPPAPARGLTMPGDQGQAPAWERWGAAGPLRHPRPRGWSARALPEQLGVIVSQVPPTPDLADGRFTNSISALVDPAGQDDSATSSASSPASSPASSRSSPTSGSSTSARRPSTPPTRCGCWRRPGCA